VSDTRFREPGSVILREFKAAMEARRAGQVVHFAQQAGATRRNFEAAQSNRLTAGWTTWDASINALLQQSLQVLRTRSRQWGRNTGPGRRFLNMVRDGGVGPNGYTLAMRCGDWVKETGGWKFKLDKLANDAIERAWLEWCERGNCEATGRLSFADVCKLELEIAARDGEFLAKRLRGASNKWNYKLQLLATDRIDTTLTTLPRAGNEVCLGIERNEAGEMQAAYILRGHPGDYRGTREADRVPAKDLLHDFVAIDAEQARGVPWSHAILLGAHMLASFEESAVFAARVGASHMGFFFQDAVEGGPIKTEDLGAAQGEGGDAPITDVEPGALELLPRGIKDFKAFDSKYPSEAFDPFTKSRKRDMATGLNVANHNFTGDMTGVNYSSARIAELGERDHWRGVAHWFVGSFVRPVFMDWLEMALLSGAIKLPGGQTLPATKLEKYAAGVVFRGRGWDWVDPLKEVQAAKVAREEGFATRTQIVASKGGDFEDNVLELAHEEEVIEEAGVKLGAPTPPAAAAAAPAGSTKLGKAAAAADDTEEEGTPDE
jgi:lambda family phage portal protein